MLLAVDVPGFDCEQDCSFDFAGVVGVAKSFEECGIIVDDPCGAPDLDALAVGVVHEEEKRLRVFGEVAEGDVLSVAAEVSEAEGFLVEDFEEAGGAAAVLDVGLASCIGGSEVEHVEVGQECFEVFGDGGFPSSAAFHAGVAAARAFLLLDAFDGGGEGDVAGVLLLVV